MRLPPRQRLIQRMADEGYRVIEGTLNGAVGWYRHTMADCYRWECWAVPPGQSVKRHFYSYSTMTDCARRGVVVTRDAPLYEADNPSYEVFAKQKGR